MPNTDVKHVIASSNAPLVSIVLPTYNRAEVLPHAIASVLAQTYESLELIIVDDNSPDNTFAVVNSFNDSRIRYVKNEPNLKLPRALNRGFSLAAGELLTWTSDDNLLCEDAIEKMVGFIEEKSCDFVYADYYLFSELDENNKPTEAKRDYLPDMVQLEKGNHIGACFLYTRALYEKIGDYDPELFLVEDYDYFMRAAQHFTFCHLPEALYYFRRDDNTLYCSRFCEVKCSDVLVRYKNGLLEKSVLTDTLISLILRDINGIKNPLLRWGHRALEGKSYRLSNLYQRLTSAYFKSKLRKPIDILLNEFSVGNASFKNTRDSIKARVEAIGRIEYDKV